LTAPEFLAEGTARAKVKKPTEFVVSAVRALGGRVDTRGALELARAASKIGERLYQVEPPTGYEGRAEAWMNSNGLLARINFAIAVANGRVPGVVIDIDRVMDGVDRRQADAVLARLERVTLGDQVTEQTRASFARMLEDPQIKGPTPDDVRRRQSS